MQKKKKSRQFLKDAKKKLNAIALPSSVSSANAIPRGDIINNGHKFSASDLIELDRAFTESEGGPVHLPDHIKGKLVDNIRSSQVSNLEDIFIEIEIGDGLSHITPTVIMRMLNNLQISIKKISSEIAIQGMSDIGTRIRRVTDVGTGGTTYGWLSMFSGSLKKIDKMGASWKRQRDNSDKGLEIKKNMVKLIYNNMVSILIIDKNCAIKTTTVKKYNEDELYKKAGFKSSSGFARHNVWNLGSNVNIHLFGKIVGRAGQENKYDFPPPIDKQLFFGSCVLVNYTDDDEVIDLNSTQWKIVYDKLFGGFEDIGDEDSDESSDDADDDIPKTKDGYAKDGFVVDNDDDDDDDDEDYEDTKYKKKITKKKVSNRGNKLEKTIVSNNDNCYLGCTSELTEEQYI